MRTQTQCYSTAMLLHMVDTLVAKELQQNSSNLDSIGLHFFLMQIGL